MIEIFRGNDHSTREPRPFAIALSEFSSAVFEDTAGLYAITTKQAFTFRISVESYRYLLKRLDGMSHDEARLVKTSVNDARETQGLPRL